MERVEIGDVAIAYDNPFSGETFLLVMEKCVVISIQWITTYSLRFWSCRAFTFPGQNAEVPVDCIVTGESHHP